MNAKSRLPEIVEAWKTGKTLAEIGRSIGVSRERIRQLLKLSGLSSKDGGRFVKPKKVKKIIMAEKLALSVEEYRRIKRIRPNPISKYLQQIYGAKRRGIRWELSFADWWEIWQKSGKYPERGTGRGRYSMCRFGDHGPYAKGNVFIGESIDNVLKFRHLRRRPGVKRGYSSSAKVAVTMDGELAELSTFGDCIDD